MIEFEEIKARLNALCDNLVEMRGYLDVDNRRAMLERLEEDKQAVMADQKEVVAEAKGEGYDVKTLRKVIRIRKQDKAKRQEEEAILDLYLSALGEV